VAVNVIDLFEPIDADEHEGCLFSIALCPPDLVADLALEESAVGSPGQRIVFSEELELFPVSQARADVTRDRGDADDFPVAVADRRDGQRDFHGGSVLGAELEPGPPHARAGVGRVEGTVTRVLIMQALGCQQVDAPAQQILAAIAKQFLGLGVDKHDHPAAPTPGLRADWAGGP